MRLSLFEVSLAAISNKLSALRRYHLSEGRPAPVANEIGDVAALQLSLSKTSHMFCDIE